METCDQPLIFDNSIEPEEGISVLQWIKSGFVGLARRIIPQKKDPPMQDDVSCVSEACEQPLLLETSAGPLVQREASEPHAIPDKLDAKIRKHLMKNFSLEADDIPDNFVVEVIRARINDTLQPEKNNTLVFLYQELLKNEGLLSKAITRCIEKTDAYEIREEAMIGLISDVRSQVSNAIKHRASFSLRMTVESNRIVVESIKKGKRNEIVRQRKQKRREEALEGIRKNSVYESITKKWSENPHKLTDAEMEILFEREKSDNMFLTTFCDTAQFGLRNKFLFEHANSVDSVNENYEKFVITTKGDVLELLESDDSEDVREKRFLPENSVFTKNGTEAFRFFYRRYLNNGDLILATSEEYCEITDLIRNGQKDKDPKDRKKIDFRELPQYKRTKKYLKAIKDELSKKRPGKSNCTYILVSHESRRGSVFPLKEISELIKEVKEKTGRKIYLVVDACQSAGRAVIDLNDFNPDVFFASCSKGMDFGRNVGFVAFASDFVSDKRRSSNEILHDNNDIETGTLNKTDMAMFQLGLNPQSIGKGGTISEDPEKDALIKKTLLSVEERHETNLRLATKFLELAHGVNEQSKIVKRRGETIKEEGRLEILYPTMVYDKDGKVNEGRFHNIFECRVKGLERKEVIGIAQSFGVIIQDYSDEAEKGASFRIALHPFMGNDALKIIGYMLDECCIVSRKKEREAKRNVEGVRNTAA